MSDDATPTQTTDAPNVDESDDNRSATDVRSIHNQSDTWAIALNTESTWNSFWVWDEDTVVTNGLWISWHESKPLRMVTKKGYCDVWERDSRIYGRWGKDGEKYVILEGPKLGGHVNLIIDEEGELILK